MDPHIRVATTADAAAVRDIYAPFCSSSAVTFEETPPTADEMADRIESTLEQYPWLVAESEDGTVLGYAYAGPLRKRQAYQWVVELSVYVAADARQSGVGRTLYTSLLAVLEAQGFYEAYAVTTLPNPATVAFHESFGFERIVDFPAMGYTQDEWHDVCWWRYQLSAKETEPEPPTPFPEFRTTAGSPDEDANEVTGKKEDTEETVLESLLDSVVQEPSL
ncbi:phosphinothricin acetyltransferase [Natrialba hulunbeirensis JCM 10989]|uniref:Phosphinothricin acetyltransferase n=1 Tax=Natrialba hulunbeirensis JCM 10989 TaxID=1227493 RepID=L9ZX80_9EURY|nr:GNAT family N-acetyltransferase [Natrialba hulunbeirensis]ELY91100.1 phosphinothricin acetyltransferase [Natrialba hulunbeirensis JCM 10989]